MSNDFLKSLSDDEKNRLKSIKETYFKERKDKSLCSFEGFCFLLGAGASTEAGLPEWDVLVKNLCEKYNLNINVDKNKVIEIVGAIETKIIETMSKKSDYAQIERYIRHLGHYDEIRRVLYRPEVKRNIALHVQDLLIDSAKPEEDEKKDLMNTISKICVERTCKHLRTSVITYNYDDYLEYKINNHIEETALKRANKDKIKNAIRVHDFSDKQLPCIRQHRCFGTDIYHVHGHLDVFMLTDNDNKTIPSPGCDEGIILSADDYLELSEHGVLSWTNQVQHSLLSSMPIIVIGFSMEDANFRLIIRRLQQAKMMQQHIIMFLGHDGSKEKAKSVETGKVLIRELLRSSNDTSSADDHDLLKIITCEYENIPNILKYFFSDYFK